jgi:hypothetical protein
MSLLLALYVGAQLPAADDGGTGSMESVRAQYRADAEKYSFYAAARQTPPLALTEKPVLRWSSLNDYSGDVFIWTSEGLPIVVGCMLSGPSGPRARRMIHEFHLVGQQPTMPLDLLSHQRWEPASGLSRTPVPGAAAPASSAAGRLAQLRQLSRAFAVRMEAVNGDWDLRLLPQPLFRYGDDGKEVVDGALFAYVWTTGTDPEFLLLLECRKTPRGMEWQFAPVRLTLRPLRLEHQGKEVWRVGAHQEPPQTTALLYTSGAVRTFEVKVAPHESPMP